MGCFGGRSRRREPKKPKIRYEGIELGGKGLHRMECSTPMPDENELNAMFTELVVSKLQVMGIIEAHSRIPCNCLCSRSCSVYKEAHSSDILPFDTNPRSRT